MHLEFRPYQSSLPTPHPILQVGPFLTGLSSSYVLNQNIGLAFHWHIAPMSILIKWILIIVKALYRKTTLLKVMLESKYSVLCSCTDMTSKFCILIFFTFWGNYYIVDQTKILWESKLTTRSSEERLSWKWIHKTCSPDTQDKRSHDYMTTEDVFYHTPGSWRRGGLPWLKEVTTGLTLDQGVTKYGILLKNKKRILEVVFKLNH